MKNERTKTVVIYAILGLIGVASLVCIIYSMVADRTAPFLGLGLALAGFGNVIGMITVYKKKGNNDGSSKDGSIS